MSAPLDVGRVRLRNRIVSAPMERNYAGVDGHLTDAYIAYLAARAAGGVALVYTEASYVRLDGKARRRQMGVHEDGVIDGLRRLADAVHAHGALLGVEINHGGRTAQTAVNGSGCVAPSPVPCVVMGGEIPRELDDEDILELIGCYAAAAQRCARAGVDVISLHAAHGYLVSQFMSPRTNLRSDRWAEPLRFLSAVIEAVRDAVGALTFGMRLSAFEGVDGGLDADATFELIRAAPLARLDFLDVSAGCYEAPEWTVQLAEWPEGLLGEHAARYRGLGLPVSVAGRVRLPETVERLLAESADMVAIARSLHADPRWLERVGAGSRARPCIVCNHCVDELGKGDPIACAVNPAAGREHELLAAAVEPWQGAALAVTVVGAGPAGLEAARALATRGHRVTVLERADAIGGELRLAAVLRAYPHHHEILEWYERTLAELGVAVRLRARADAGALLDERPDAIVLATGGEATAAEVPGAGLERVVEVRRWIERGKPDLGTQLHIVWGADRDGVAVADELLAMGRRVLVIGPQPDLAPEAGRRARLLVVRRLREEPRAECLLEHDVVAIERERLAVRGSGGQQRWLEHAGPILISRGVTPDTALQEELCARGASVTLAVIGAAAGHAGIAAAIADGGRAVAEVERAHAHV